MGNLKLKQYIACNNHQTSQEVHAIRITNKRYKINQELLATFPDVAANRKVRFGPGKVYHVSLINSN
jgi:urease beta subunit